MRSIFPVYKSGYFKLDSRDPPVPLMAIADKAAMFRRCKLLYDKVALIGNYTTSTLDNIDFVERESAGLPASESPDSDDEQIADVGRMSVYTAQERHILVRVLKNLTKQYIKCIQAGFYNAEGKYFHDYMGEFLSLSNPVVFQHATASSGDTMPGSARIKWVSGKIGTCGASGGTTTPQHHTRFGGVSGFDELRNMYVIVTEIKRGLEAVESQHNEQMVETTRLPCWVLRCRELLC